MLIQIKQCHRVKKIEIIAIQIRGFSGLIIIMFKSELKITPIIK